MFFALKSIVTRVNTTGRDAHAHNTKNSCKKKRKFGIFQVTRICMFFALKSVVTRVILPAEAYAPTCRTAERGT